MRASSLRAVWVTKFVVVESKMSLSAKILVRKQYELGG